MDFGNYEGLRKPHAFVSADMILYRQAQFTGDFLGDVEILVSTRTIEPFQNYLSLTFGGYIDPTDNSPLHTAVRETKEESGIDLSNFALNDFTFLGSFGPARMHQRIKTCSPNDLSYLTETENTKMVGNPRPCVTFVFAHECKTKHQGTESDEATSIRWMTLREIITNYGNTIAFDHAEFLELLINRLRGYETKYLLKQSGTYIYYHTEYHKP